MATTPVFLPGESQGQRSLAGYSPWDRKELNTTECTSTQPKKKDKFIKERVENPLEHKSRRHCLAEQGFQARS